MSRDLLHSIHQVSDEIWNQLTSLEGENPRKAQIYKKDLIIDLQGNPADFEMYFGEERRGEP